MDIEIAKEILKCCMNDDCTKCEADVFDCVRKHNEAIETVLSELEKKEAIINEMAEWITKIGSTIFCDKSECNDNCEECVIKEFTNKVEKEGK